MKHISLICAQDNLSVFPHNLKHSFDHFKKQLKKNSNNGQTQIFNLIQSE